MTHAPRKNLAAAAALWLSGVPVLTACGGEEEQTTQETYCVNQDGEVIDPDDCDDDGSYHGGSTFIWLSSTHYEPGHRVPANQRRSFIPNTPDARANAGLPRTGQAAGTTVRHSGGFGGNGDSGGG